MRIKRLLAFVVIAIVLGASSVFADGNWDEPCALESGFGYYCYLDMTCCNDCHRCYYTCPNCACCNSDSDCADCANDRTDCDLSVHKCVKQATTTTTSTTSPPSAPSSPPIVSNAQARPDRYDDTGETDDDTQIYFTWSISGSADSCYAELNDATPDESAGTDGRDTDTGREGSNTYYVRCRNAGGYGNTDSDTITINLPTTTTTISGECNCASDSDCWDVFGKYDCYSETELCEMVCATEGTCDSTCDECIGGCACSPYTTCPEGTTCKDGSCTTTTKPSCPSACSDAGYFDGQCYSGLHWCGEDGYPPKCSVGYCLHDCSLKSGTSCYGTCLCYNREYCHPDCSSRCTDAGCEGGPGECSGPQGVLDLEPSPAYADDNVTATISGLSGCEGETVYFIMGESCDGTPEGECTVSDSSCYDTFEVRCTPLDGEICYIACAGDVYLDDYELPVKCDDADDCCLIEGERPWCDLETGKCEVGECIEEGGTCDPYNDRCCEDQNLNCIGGVCETATCNENGKLEAGEECDPEPFCADEFNFYDIDGNPTQGSTCRKYDTEQYGTGSGFLRCIDCKLNLEGCCIKKNGQCDTSDDKCCNDEVQNLVCEGNVCVEGEEPKEPCTDAEIGEEETRKCSNYGCVPPEGTKTRVCEEDGWSEWSPCEGETGCIPGEVDCDKNRVCKNNCDWESVDPGDIEEICCEKPDCWDELGDACVDSGDWNANKDGICINGNLIPPNKISPGGTPGYCSDALCLTDDLTCESDGYFTEDYYCDNGDWISRTKYIALQLIDIADGDYVIFCDDSAKTLNYLEYAVDGKTAKALIDENAYNFCVLVQDNDNKVFGTPLKNDITDPETIKFLKTLGISGCTISGSSNQFYKCAEGGGKVWYNPHIQSVIYSKQSIDIGATEFLTIFTDFIKDPFGTIFNYIKNQISPKPDEASFVNQFRWFDRLYLSKKGAKEIIRGAIEGRSVKNLVLEYKNFDSDICTSINLFDEKYRDSFSGIKCKKEGNTYYVLAQGMNSDNIDPDAIWSDLTAKLR